MIRLLCALVAFAITTPCFASEEDAPPAKATAPQTLGLVNLNDATPDELEHLPGIGPSKARAIIDYRKAHPFRKIEELTKVKGIGRKTFAKLRPFLSLAGKTTLREATR